METGSATALMAEAGDGLHRNSDRRTRQCTVAVCVPVRDERRRLPALLAALRRQTGCERQFAACFLFDGADRVSEARAHDAALGAPFRVYTRTLARARIANAGRARRAALALGMQTLAGAPDAVLLTTDADTVPADDWVAANLASLREIDVVAGRIRRAHPRRLATRYRLERYLDRLRHLQRILDPISYDPAPSHWSVGGASLGFRAQAYQAIGGFEDCASDEDARIVMKARRAGFRVRHDRHVRVTTSSRRRGRAAGGLADELARAGTDNCLPRVEDPVDAVRKYANEAAARRFFGQASCQSACDELAQRLAIPASRIRALAQRAPTAEAFTMLVVPPAVDARSVDLAEAEVRLAELEAEHGCASQ